MTDNVAFSLSTIVVRPLIQIDGGLHEMLSPEELPILSSHRVAAIGRRYEVLMRQDVLDEAEQKELKKCLDDICGIILEPVAASVKATLSDANKVAVMEGFTVLLLRRRVGAMAAMMETAQETLSVGEKSSPASSDFTVETPATGSSAAR